MFWWSRTCWRALFLDAQSAEKMMTRVAQLLRDETGLDPDLNSFMNLCRQYRIEGLTA
jgi:hypothetical protein